MACHFLRCIIMIQEYILPSQLDCELIQNTKGKFSIWWILWFPKAYSASIYNTLPNIQSESVDDLLGDKKEKGHIR